MPKVYRHCLVTRQSRPRGRKIGDSFLHTKGNVVAVIQKWNDSCLIFSHSSNGLSKRKCMKKTFILLLLSASLSSSSARTHSYPLSDGVVVTLDAQPTQTVITLAGQPFANHRIDCTVAFDGWVTLTNCTLDGSGSFT